MLFVLEHWWASVIVVVAVVVLISMAVMATAGLCPGYFACPRYKRRYWMLHSIDTPWDDCRKRNAAAAEEELRRFQRWLWHPLDGTPMPVGWEPESPHSGFSTEHRLPFSNQYHVPGRRTDS
jgi:hypothetical protein